MEYEKEILHSKWQQQDKSGRQDSRQTTLELRGNLKLEPQKTNKADSISTGVPRVYCRQYDKSSPVVPATV